LLAKGYSNATLNIVLDKGASRLGYVSFMASKVTSYKPRDRNAVDNDQDAHIITIPKSELKTTEAFIK
jgi:hypothetical protein